MRRCNSIGSSVFPFSLILTVLLLSSPFACAPPTSHTGDESLQIGLLFDYTGALGDFGSTSEKAVRLAVDHIQSAGGVLGHPVQLTVADGATEPAASVREAWSLAEAGVHAIIGPFGSAATMAVAEAVTASVGIPTISPSATAPEVSSLADNGFLFRSAISDAAQGPVLARLAESEGYTRVAVLYRDDPYGRGLRDAFASTFTGEITAGAAVEPGGSTFLPELRRLSAAGPEVLIAISFPREAQIYVREALEEGLFERFLFTDAMVSAELADDFVARNLEGMKGTAHGSMIARPSAGAEAFSQAYQQRFGEPSPTGPAAGAYDAAICIALAAEQAGTLERAAIRDALPEVCGGEGERYLPGEESVTAAFAAVRSGRKVNFDGAATSVDWNSAGDVARGYVATWQFQAGEVVPIDFFEFNLE